MNKTRTHEVEWTFVMPTLTPLYRHQSQGNDQRAASSQPFNLIKYKTLPPHLLPQALLGDEEGHV